MKKILFNKNMLISALMAVTMTATSAVLPATAATINRNISSSRKVTACVKSGKGWQYSLGWKTTSVTITNTSSKGGITVGTPLTCYYVNKGRSVRFNIRGSGKYAYYTLRRSGIGTRKFKVATSAGSVYTY